MAIPLSKMVIFFKTGAEFNELFLLDQNKIVFPSESYWQVLLDYGTAEMKVILKNCQSNERKTVSYGVLGKLFCMKTGSVILMEEKDVPCIIKIE